MGLMDFIKKQFIDIIQWTEDGDGTLAWRFPMRDMEIQYGASLTVRESQMAVFVNEGKVADVFGPGMYKLTTQTIPVLTYLKNWDKLFESPFKSEVYFFSTRQQVDQKWGTSQPVTIRDKDFGAVRLRAFGNYSFRIADPKLFHTEISGTRESYGTQDLDGQLRGLVLQHLSDAIAQSGIPFLDLAANQIEFAKALSTELTPAFAAIGLKLEGMTVQNVSLPEELQKDPGPEDWHGHGRQRHGQVHAVPDGAGHPEICRRRRRWWQRYCRRRHGPGRRCGAGPGAGAEPAAGAAGWC
jgi:membrane protease subunit (stomatin/prohibitin family)